MQHKTIWVLSWGWANEGRHVEGFVSLLKSSYVMTIVKCKWRMMKISQFQLNGNCNGINKVSFNWLRILVLKNDNTVETLKTYGLEEWKDTQLELLLQEMNGN